MDDKLHQNPTVLCKVLFHHDLQKSFGSGDFQKIFPHLVQSTSLHLHISLFSVINMSVISKTSRLYFALSCQVWCWSVSKTTLTVTSTWWPTPTWRATWKEGSQSTRNVTPQRGSSRGGNTPGGASIAPLPPLTTKRTGPRGGRLTTLTPLISKIVLKEVTA